MLLEKLKKLKESKVKNFIYELKQDKVFVEWAKNSNAIKGFKFNDIDIAVVKETQFVVYPGVDKCAIKFELFKHKNVAGAAELYEIARAKLYDHDYQDKMKKREEEISKVLRFREFGDEDAPMPSYVEQNKSR